MKKYKTCKDAFKSIGLQYDSYLYKCYNEEITSGTKLCPFAEKDTCSVIKWLEYLESIILHGTSKEKKKPIGILNYFKEKRIKNGGVII